MKVLEFHLDDLVDREMSGTLTPSERIRLDDHLVRCTSCRLEQMVRDDFDRELADEGPISVSEIAIGAMRAAELQTTGLEMAALGIHEHAPKETIVASKVESSNSRNAIQEPKHEHHQRPSVHATSTRKAPRRFVLSLAAAAVLVGGVAVARNGSPLRAWNYVVDSVRGSKEEVRELASQRTTVTRAASRALETAAVAQGRPTASVNEPESPSVDAREAERREFEELRAIEAVRVEREESLAHTRPVLASASGGIAGGANSAGSAPRTKDLSASSVAYSTTKPPFVSSGAPTVPSATPTAASSGTNSAMADAPRETSALLFDRATHARRFGNRSEATRLYGELLRNYPASSEARLSLATLARLNLDAGDTASALDGFTRYLVSGDSSLREEAMEGRAVALRRLGHSAEERDAWDLLLRSYPDSVYAPLATQRMQTLKP